MNSIVVEYLEDIPASDQWRLVRDVFFEVSYYGKVTVPAGYVTDFASSPPFLWSLFPAIGKYNRAALIHDFLYENRMIAQGNLSDYEARLLADKIFLEIANTVNPRGKTKHYLMFWAIRLFGRNRFLR
ncbi:DUF1353 domain-containing protein [Flectobacillus major]|uniref:DUF1353 domain-containing protein n=1 Tax=Flectobacillus major TaxID=103 RepID=UPI0005C4A633|nr:DUF1353 domain-containing protein [Flectobacillus major]